MASVVAQRNLERIGHYVITRVLGRGSTSTVYLAHDLQCGTDVALKLYHPDNVRPERAHTRRKLYGNEARLAGELNHPNLVLVLDAGVSGDDAYIVTEYLRGATPLNVYTRLIDLLPQQKVAEILFACAKALAALFTVISNRARSCSCPMAHPRLSISGWLSIP